jgi:hypothetical protein
MENGKCALCGLDSDNATEIKISVTNTRKCILYSRYVQTALHCCYMFSRYLRYSKYKSY